MKPLRIPSKWRDLHPGDKTGSRLPLHRINKYFAALSNEGYKFTAWPSERGYWIVCQERPK